jgi:hypothetical protein
VGLHCSTRTPTPQPYPKQGRLTKPNSIGAPPILFLGGSEMTKQYLAGADSRFDLILILKPLKTSQLSETVLLLQGNIGIYIRNFKYSYFPPRSIPGEKKCVISPHQPCDLKAVICGIRPILLPHKSGPISRINQEKY